MAPLLGVLAGQGRDDLGQRGAVAAQQPEDARIAAATERRGQRIVVRRWIPDRRLGRDRRQMADHPAGLRFLAGGQRFACREAGGLGHLGGDPRRIGLDREPLEVQPDGRGGLSFTAQDGGRLAGVGVDRVDLEQPGARGRLDRVARHGARPPVAEPGLGVVLRPPHGARIGRGRGRLGRRLVLVVGALRRSMGLLGGAGLGPGADRELAALVGEAAGLGARTGRLPPASWRLAPTAPTARRRPRRRRCRSARQGAPWRSANAWAVAALAAADARSAVRVGSAPPEIGSGRRGATGPRRRLRCRSGRPGPGWTGPTSPRAPGSERTGVRRSMTPGRSRAPSPRRSAGPPRAGSAVADPGEGVVGERRGSASRNDVGGDRDAALHAGQEAVHAGSRPTPRRRRRPGPDPAPGTRTRWRSRCPHLPPVALRTERTRHPREAA